VKNETAPVTTNTTFAINAAEWHSPSHSWKVTKTNAAGTGASVDLVDNNLTTDMHGLGDGQKVTWTLWIKIPPATIDAYEIGFYIYDYQGSWDGTSVAPGALYGAWQQVTVTRTIRGAATGTMLRIVIASTAILNANFYIDDISCTVDKTEGIIESVAIVPTTGAEDEIWAVVKWTIGGATKRYIVYFNTLTTGTKEAAHYLDCGYYNSAAASATIYNAAVPQLAGETVWATINGNVVEKNLTVGAGGTVAIAATNATAVHIGLPYTSYAQTMRIDQNSAWGSGLGLSKRLGNLNVWVHKTIGGEFGPTSSVTEAVTYSSTSELTTDCLSINFPGQWDRDGYIWCIQRDPFPMTVVAVAPDMEMGDR
jgi:hypothetical protein